MRFTLSLITLVLVGIPLTQNADFLHFFSNHLPAGFLNGQNADNRLTKRLQLEPGNPYLWTRLAEERLQAGAPPEEVEKLYARALELGPKIPPILMRTANYYYGRGDFGKAAPLFRRSLELTDAFNAQIFLLVMMHLRSEDQPLRLAYEQVLPARPQVAAAWLHWLTERPQGSQLAANHLPGTQPADGPSGAPKPLAPSTPEVVDAWQWASRQTNTQDATAAAVCRWLFSRGAYAEANQIWRSRRPALSAPNLLLTNARFQHEFSSSPFDWTLIPHPAAYAERQEEGGLFLRFNGSENLHYANLFQFALVAAGEYELEADLSTIDLTTDQRPRFHIFGAGRPFSVLAPMLPANAYRGKYRTRFRVPAEVQCVGIRLERQPSRFLDSKLSGEVRLFALSLRRVGA